MKRRGVFTGLLGLIGGAASAQVNNPDRPRSTLAEGWKRKPDNNECPVCGTVAEAYVGKRDPMMNDLLWAEDGGKIVARQVRCKFCSCAFWQDVEGQVSA